MSRQFIYECKNETLFFCYADLSNFSFVVVLLNSDDYDKATKIAERELTRWCNPTKQEELSEDEKSYYENAGYIEVVEDAFIKEGINAEFYDRE